MVPTPAITDLPHSDAITAKPAQPAIGDLRNQCATLRIRPMTYAQRVHPPDDVCATPAVTGDLDLYTTDGKRSSAVAVGVTR